jgi:hypothetical protein
VNNLTSATDRFFRLYSKQCLEPDEDTLFALLNALHSFNDKLRKSVKDGLFGSVEFVALKSLRNLFHHEAELLHEVKIIPAMNLPIVSDLMILCLVERSLVEQAARFGKKDDPDKVIGAFRWYGAIANIQPCIFNAAVDVYEAIQPLGLTLTSTAYQEFDASYQIEEDRGHSHRISGVIACRAGDVGEVLQKIFSQS